MLAGASDWKKLLRRAKSKHPLEFVEAIWGTETVDSFRISDFNRMRIKDAAKNSLEYDDEEIVRQKALAHAAGKTFLGTIHSHPHVDYSPAPSDTDHEEGILKGERVMGILHLWKDRKTKRFCHDIAWWFPQSRIPFEVLPD